MTATLSIPLSVFIITKDEADRVGAVIASVAGLADEVVVVDSGSSDDTVAVAEAGGARVLYHPFTGYGAQKCFAEAACKNRWLLNLDGDEPLTDQARHEIMGLLQNGDILRFDCWSIPIRTVYPHEREPALWAFSYNQIRLYDREKAGFSSSTVHDSVVPQHGARIGQLKGAIAHYSHRTIDFQVTKFNRYSQMQLDDMLARGRKIPKIRLVTEFPIAFLKAYFIRRHFLYGLWGVSLSISYAYSRFLRIAKYHEATLMAAKTQKHLRTLKPPKGSRDAAPDDI